MKKHFSKIIHYGVAILLACLFFASAYFKLIAFDSFEFQIAELGFVSIQAAGYLGFVIIFAEFFMAFYLLLYRYDKYFNGLVWGSLILFTTYLLYLYITKGNNISCGCMGDAVVIKPLTAIFKNVVTGILFYLLIKLKPNNSSGFRALTHKYSFGINLVCLAIAFQYTYYLSPVYFSFDNSYENKAMSAFDAQSAIVDKGKFYPSEPFFEQNDKYLLGFLSLSCAHCQKAADRLGVIKSEQPDLPIFIVLNGDSTKVDSFRKAHKITNIPATLLFKENFSNIAGENLPIFFTVRNDTIQNVLNARDLNTFRLNNWIRE